MQIFFRESRKSHWLIKGAGIAMREGNKKEKWDKPKLIILTRGEPEERVLDACKGDVSGAVSTTVSNCPDIYDAIPPARLLVVHSSAH